MFHKHSPILLSVRLHAVEELAQDKTIQLEKMEQISEGIPLEVRLLFTRHYVA